MGKNPTMAFTLQPHMLHSDTPHFITIFITIAYETTA